MITTPLFLDVEDLRRKWGWFLVLGIALVVLGTVAFILVPAATIASVLVLGWLMVVSGVLETVHGFRMRGWGGVFLHLIAGIVGVLIGLLIVTHPVAGALAWTLLFASFLTVIGLFRAIAAIRLKFPNWEVGSFRWNYYPRAGNSSLGRVAVVGVVVLGCGAWSFLNAARLVVCNVGDRGSQLAYTQHERDKASGLKFHVPTEGRAGRCASYGSQELAADVENDYYLPACDCLPPYSVLPCW